MLFTLFYSILFFPSLLLAIAVAAGGGGGGSVNGLVRSASNYMIMIQKITISVWYDTEMT